MLHHQLGSACIGGRTWSFPQLQGAERNAEAVDVSHQSGCGAAVMLVEDAVGPERSCPMGWMLSTGCVLWGGICSHKSQEEEENGNKGNPAASKRLLSLAA